MLCAGFGRTRRRRMQCLLCVRRWARRKLICSKLLRMKWICSCPNRSRLARLTNFSAAYIVSLRSNVAFHPKEDTVMSSEQRISAEVLIEETENDNRVNDDFLAALVHQVRTPLATIQTWTQILRLGKGDLQKGLAQIERSARDQSELLDDLLDLSLIQSGKVHLKLSVIDPVDCLSAAVESVRAFSDEKSIPIETEFDSSAAKVNADPGRLQQVFRNLLMNAIKFTPSMGRVTVRLNQTGERSPEEVQIQVKDTGKGIEAD